MHERGVQSLACPSKERLLQIWYMSGVVGCGRCVCSGFGTGTWYGRLVRLCRVNKVSSRTSEICVLRQQQDRKFVYQNTERSEVQIALICSHDMKMYGFHKKCLTWARLCGTPSILWCSCRS